MNDRDNQEPPRRGHPKPGTPEEYRELKDDGDRFEQEERRTEEEIEAELRREHFGHEPERPPTWKRPPD